MFTITPSNTLWTHIVLAPPAQVVAAAVFARHVASLFGRACVAARSSVDSFGAAECNLHCLSFCAKLPQPRQDVAIVIHDRYPPEGLADNVPLGMARGSNDHVQRPAENPVSFCRQSFVRRGKGQHEQDAASDGQPCQFSATEVHGAWPGIATCRCHGFGDNRYSSQALSWNDFRYSRAGCDVKQTLV